MVAVHTSLPLSLRRPVRRSSGLMRRERNALRDRILSQAEQVLSRVRPAISGFDPICLKPSCFRRRPKSNRLTNAGALKLLGFHQEVRGTPINTCFWLAEPGFGEPSIRRGGLFRGLGETIPASPRRLEAVIREATARAQLSDWPRVWWTCSRKTNGVFQLLGRTCDKQCCRAFCY